MLYLLVLFLLGVTAEDYTGHRLISIKAETKADVEFLNTLSDNPDFLALDFWTEASLHHEVQVRVSPYDFDKLRQVLGSAGLTFRVVNENIQELVDREKMSMAKSPKVDGLCNIEGTYCTFEEISDWLSVKDADPLVEVSTMNTYSAQSRPIFQVKIASDMNNPKEAIWIEAGTHAREWISVSSAVNLIEKLSDSTDSFSIEMLQNFDFYIVPVHNPDGYVYSHTTSRLWRKNRQTCLGIGNGVGTDLNRNWDSGWGGAGTSNFCSSDVYRGTEAFSASETKALRDAVFDSMQYTYVRAFFSVHCYAEFMLVPYGYTDIKPTRYEHLMNVSQHMMKYLETVDGRYYLVGTPPDILYAASGGAYDYFYDLGIPYSYTYELRPQYGTTDGFIIDQSNIPTAATELFASLWAFATYDGLNYDVEPFSAKQRQKK